MTQWLLTPEEIVEASKEKANMPEDWARRQLQKVIQRLAPVCTDSDHGGYMVMRARCGGCLAEMMRESGI